MKHTLKYLLFALLLALATDAAAQTTQWRDIYQAKKKDTLFGIARKYGISVPDLIEANPEMKKAGYELKKGDTVFIPFEKKQTVAVPASPVVKPTAELDVTKRAIRIGVMLPLHNVDGDGQRMVEYYRGLLLACEDLKVQGISTDVRAWNVPMDADIRETLLEKEAARCDLIFGPLYTKQVRPLSDFCREHDIKLVIPFSIESGEVANNGQVFQVYQSAARLNERVIGAYLDRFAGYHPVFVDCNDTTSRKGIFTFNLRKQLEARNIGYNITNLTSGEANFAKCFSTTQPNMVILNTGRSPELNVALAKIDGLKTVHPQLSVSLFGYTEWLMYTKVYLDYFCKYDAYIPTAAYYNPLSAKTRQVENNYRRWFNEEMRAALPRFALTGYDQVSFFCKGLHKYGKSFSGIKTENVHVPLQTPLHFKCVGKGGMQNENLMLIHYKRDRTIESITY